MSTTSGLDVEIDEAIRKQPGLLDAVEDASRFLESRIRKADIPDLRDMQLSWGFNPLEKGWVEASLRVWWRDSGISPIRLIPLHDMFGPKSRHVWMWRLWGDVLEEVSRMQIRYVDEQIRQLEEQEDRED
jgi:hypothetical protein